MKIGFIGLGNMASAIIRGMVASGQFKSADILGYDTFTEAAKKIQAAAGITICDSLADVTKADVLVLAVKPQIMPSLFPELQSLKLAGKLFVSIAGGKTISFLEDGLGKDQPIIRVMPNINAVVAAATCAFTANGKATDAHKKIVSDIFSTVGTIIELPETLFPVFVAIGGASPAFAYMYIDALARAGVKNGLSRPQALQIAASTVFGSAKMILESKEHPFTLIDQVCSPGGSTIEGICTLQELGFESATHKAIQAVIQKDFSMR